MVSGSTTDTLMYLSYGAGPHTDEAIYSMLSALRHLGARGQCRIAVYTDDPTPFADLPVVVQHVSEQVMKEWGGPFGFGHRRKIVALRHALARFGGRVLYCDADTWFRTHPKRALARVGPGRSLLHIAEYRLSDPCARRLAESLAGHAFRDLSGQPWAIGGATAMFNAGVIGLHETDAALVDEVLHLTDQIYYFAPLVTIEQLAFSVCLREHTKLRQCYDVIAHYWKPKIRAAFREQLDRTLHTTPRASWAAVRRELSRSAPRPMMYPFQYGSPSLGRRTAARLWTVVHRMALLTGVAALRRRLSFTRRGPSERNRVALTSERLSSVSSPRHSGSRR